MFGLHWWKYLLIALGLTHLTIMDQLLTRLVDWRMRADASGVAPLRDFAARLPHLL